MENRKKTGVIVFGHTRPLHLKAVLDSLRRQGCCLDVHIWLDGHSNRSSFHEDVEQCRIMLAQQFSNWESRFMNGHIGIEKMTIDGLAFMAQRYERIIVLEDDCFPTSCAIDIFEKELDNIELLDDVYSVYGHHFLTSTEGETVSRFQGWGWATTAAKLNMILPQLIECLSMPEKEYLCWVTEQLNEDIIRCLDITPGRNCLEVMTSFFSWDSCTCLLTACRGLKHKKTGRRVVYNCGLGKGGGHFAERTTYRQIPFNMITLDEVWEYFESKPERALEHNTRGERLFQEVKLNEAQACFVKAISYDCSLADAHHNMGVALWQSGEVNKGLDHLLIAFRLDPTAKSSVVNLVNVLTSVNEHEYARQICRTYLETNPQDADVQAFMQCM